MKKLILSAAFLALGIATAAAQPPANHNAETPAVSTPSDTNPQAPAAGANSFTEAQARSRLETQGFTDVKGLVKDGNGIWRGQASKDGKTHDIAVDFQGNVTPRH
jgi:hypothetical protein